MGLKRLVVRKVAQEALRRALEEVRELQRVAIEQFPGEAEVEEELSSKDERLVVERTLRFVLDELVRLVRAAASESESVEDAAASFYVNVLCNPYVLRGLLKGVKDEFRKDYEHFYKTVFVTLFPPSQNLPLSQRFLEELKRAAEEVEVRREEEAESKLEGEDD